jgi:hypothetical protein
LKEAAKVTKKAEKKLTKASLAVGKDGEICSISMTSPIDNRYPQKQPSRARTQRMP